MSPETNIACIFCMHLVNKNVKTRRHSKNHDDGVKRGLIDNEMNVIFIVRKLLSFPEHLCIELLEKFGNPSSWLVTCSKCSEIVNDARAIHKKLIALEITLDKKRKVVTQKIIDSIEKSVSLRTKRLLESQRNWESQNYSTTALIRNTVLANELKTGDGVVDVKKLDIKNENEITHYNCLDDDDSIQEEFCIPDDGIAMETKPTQLEPQNISCSGETNVDAGDNKPSLSKRPTKVLRKKPRKLMRCSASNDSKSSKIGTYKCSHCSLSFTLPGQLRSHLKYTHWVTTSGSSKRRCPSCQKIFYDLVTFRKHCIDDHSMLLCNLCPRLFLSHSNLRKHLSVIHDGIKINKQTVIPIDKAFIASKGAETEVYKCPYCNFYSVKQCKTSLHIREVHSEVYAQIKIKRYSNIEGTSNQKTLQCDKCPVSGDGSAETNQFGSLEDLNHHKVTAHKMVQCKKCSRVFIGIGYLENHEKKYHSAESADASKLLAETEQAKVKLIKSSGETRPPTCKYCQATFETKSKLTRHHFDAHPNEMYECEKCSEKFETMSRLYFHKTAVHGEPDNPYKCPLCNYSNRRFRQIHEHRMNMHEKRTRCVCETCGDTFANERYLKFHNISKHGVKSDIDLKCSACGKIFTTPQYLKRHFNTVHLGLWRYKCPQCNIGLMSQKQVDQHVNAVHEKVLPYGCTVEGCEKKYAANYLLKSHMRRVHGPKTFKCSYCDFASGNSSQIKQHEEEKHVKSGSFQCDYCGKNYTIHRCLKQHLRMTHKIRLGRGKQAKLTDFVAQTLSAANNTSVVQSQK